MAKDGAERDDWTETMSNSPDKGPLELIRLAWKRYVRTDGDHDVQQ